MEQQFLLELQFAKKRRQNAEKRRQLELLHGRGPELTPPEPAPRTPEEAPRRREESSVDRNFNIYRAAPLTAPIYRGDSQQELANFRFDCDGYFREQPERFNTESSRVLAGAATTQLDNMPVKSERA